LAGGGIRFLPGGIFLARADKLLYRNSRRLGSMSHG
jgi:hypothetical protein